MSRFRDWGFFSVEGASLAAVNVFPFLWSDRQNCFTPIRILTLMLHYSSHALHTGFLQYMTIPISVRQMTNAYKRPSNLHQEHVEPTQITRSRWNWRQPFGWRGGKRGGPFLVPLAQMFEPICQIRFKRVSNRIFCHIQTRQNLSRRACGPLFLLCVCAEAQALFARNFVTTSSVNDCQTSILVRWQLTVV